MNTATITAAALAVAMILFAPAPVAAEETIFTGCLTTSGKLTRVKQGDQPRGGRCSRRAVQVRLAEIDRGGFTIPWKVKLRLGEAFSTPDREVQIFCYEAVEDLSTEMAIYIFGRWQGDMVTQSLGRIYHFEEEIPGVMKAVGDAYTGSIEEKYPCGSEGYVVVFNQEDD